MILGVLFTLAELVVVVQMVRSSGVKQGAIFILIICSAIILSVLGYSGRTGGSGCRRDPKSHPVQSLVASDHPPET